MTSIADPEATTHAVNSELGSTPTNDHAPTGAAIDVPLPDAGQLPALLRDCPHWILWKAEPRPGGKIAKIPVDRSGANASFNDHHTTLAEALAGAERLRRQHGPCFGVGLSFAEHMGIVGLDLDAAIADGVRADHLNWFLETFPTWAEFSISGTGAHLFFAGDFERKRSGSADDARFEIFGSIGFLAITGRAIPGSSADLAPWGACGEFLSPFLVKKQSPPPARPRADRLTDTDYEAWGRAGLESQCDELRRAVPGTIHHTMIRCATSVGRMVPHAVSFDDAVESLTAAALEAGHTDEGKVRKYVGQQIEFGSTDPSYPKERERRDDNDDVSLDGFNMGRSADGAAACDELLTSTMAGMKAQIVDYLVPGRIAFGKTHIIGARGGVGKSTLMRSVIADVTRGRPVFGMPYNAPRPIDVLLVCGEDGAEDTILPGLAAEDADLDRVHYVTGVSIRGKKGALTLTPETVELIRKKLEANPAIRLIIIDPIASYVGGKLNNNQATEVRAAVLNPLNALVEGTGATVVMIAHLNKSDGDAMNRIAGSAAYIDAVRAAYLATNDPDDPQRRLLIPIKKNLPNFALTSIPFKLSKLGEDEFNRVFALSQFDSASDEHRRIFREQLRQVSFDEPVVLDANEAMGSKTAGRGPTKVTLCAEWLKVFLSVYAYPSSEIDKAALLAGHTLDNVKEAKTELGKSCGLVSSNIGRFGGKWWVGIGKEAGWKLRPEPTVSPPETPDTPENHYSPETPETGATKDHPSQESRESRETRETLESRGNPGNVGKATVEDWNRDADARAKAKKRRHRQSQKVASDRAHTAV